MTAEPATDLPALACAEPHPLNDSLLCRHLQGHSGTHGAGPDTTWTDGLPDWANLPDDTKD